MPPTQKRRTSKKKSPKHSAKPDYHPKKYYAGLSKERKTRRRREIEKQGAMDWKDPHAYVGFKTDQNVNTRTSDYGTIWSLLFPDTKGLKEIAEVTGFPLELLTKSQNRGMAAWRTGHRPGANQQQWGYARVHSLLVKGKTQYTTDSDLVTEALKSPTANQLKNHQEQVDELIELLH